MMTYGESNCPGKGTSRYDTHGNIRKGGGEFYAYGGIER